MIDEYGLKAASLAMAVMGVKLVRRRPTTDADRLRRIDELEAAARLMAANPNVIAAAAKRERRRIKLSGAA